MKKTIASLQASPSLTRAHELRALFFSLSLPFDACHAGYIRPRYHKMPQKEAIVESAVENAHFSVMCEGVRRRDICAGARIIER